MGLEPLLKSPELTEEQIMLQNRFLEETGYGESDILSLNYDTRTFLTRNGGVYQVNEEGGINHIKGPSVDLWDRF